mmetsp:Transcript_58492/g.171085  ORF Transcript_58492/g.171085 Transcript_58492/m.171085 type:complete len:601 (-) Transcript_58492:162-1964(-)
MARLISQPLLLAAAVILAAASRSYYEVLEVAKDASAAEITKSYRRLALQWHPDKSKDPNAGERFREVAEAYEVLGDPERRRQYDAGGDDIGFAFDFDFHDAGDVFKAFFGDEDPFAGFDKIFEDLQRDMDMHMSDGQQVHTSSSAESGGFFSAVSSFLSSFTSSFSSSASGGGVKLMHRTTEMRIGPDGHKITKTTESDGKRVVEETISTQEAIAKGEEEPEQINHGEASMEGTREADEATAVGEPELAEAATHDAESAETGACEGSLKGMGCTPAEGTSTPPDANTSDLKDEPAALEPAQQDPSKASASEMGSEEAPRSSIAATETPASAEHVAEVTESQPLAGGAATETAASGTDAMPPLATASAAASDGVGAAAAPTAAGLSGSAPLGPAGALASGPTPVGGYASPFSGGATAMGTARLVGMGMGGPTSPLGPGRGAPASTTGLGIVNPGTASASAGSGGANYYGFGGVATGGSQPGGSSPFMGATGAPGLNAALGGGGETGGVSMCDSLPFVQDTEPIDTTVRHVPGSACCNTAPQPTPTNRYGCCQRCLNNPNCEVYVWQPSAGTCWLMQWKGSSRTPMVAPDRVMGERGSTPMR